MRRSGGVGSAGTVVTTRDSRSHPYTYWLALPDQDTATLIHEMQKGLPFAAFERFSDTIGIDASKLAGMVSIPSSTFARLKKSGHLNTTQSELLIRLSRLFDLCLELFGGDHEKTRRWMASPKKALGGLTPLGMASTEIGAREVEDLIGRVRHGVYS